jgi:hypothetical protein
MGGKGGRKPDLQVTTYVTSDEREIFDDYAGRFGLDAGNLLHLLWQHELRVERLGAIDAVCREPSGGAGADGLNSKVTAHLTDPVLKVRIQDRARRAGLQVSPAGAMLLREEIRVHWLSAVLDFGDSN